MRHLISCPAGILPVPYLDVAATLKRLQGNKELYLELLRDFIVVI